MKKDLHHRDPVERLRLDMLDVVHVRGECAFVVRRDAIGHVLGGKAVKRPDDADHRDVDVREDVGRRAHDGERPEDEQEDRENDEGIRPPQGESDDPHGDTPGWWPRNEYVLHSRAFGMAGVWRRGTYPGVTGKLQVCYVERTGASGQPWRIAADQRSALDIKLVMQRSASGQPPVRRMASTLHHGFPVMRLPLRSCG